jgi:DNA polymerase I-like protein with 3'-5' exonuclease and polymerase domains
MLLTVWSKTSSAKVFHYLSQVLRPVPEVSVKVVNDYTVPEGTTTILALGTDALKKLQEEKLIAKNRTTTSYRTRPQMRGGIPVLVSYSPEIGEIDHGYYVDLLTDVTLALRYCLTGKWTPVYGQYRYVQDFSDLCTSIERQHKDTGQPVDVSKDLETLGLDPYAEPVFNPPFPGAYIVSMQATHQKGKADVVRFIDRMHESQRLFDPAFREHVEFLLRCPYIRLKGANFKYDLHWLWKRGAFDCTNFTFDTTIVGSLLDENRSNALDVHTKIYVPALAGYSDQFDREVDKSRMDRVPPDQLLPYAGGDVDADLQVAEAMKHELLRDKQLTSFYVNILHPAARAFEQIEQGGILVDMDAYQELKSDLETEHARLVKDACKIMGGRIVIKHGYASLTQGRPEAMNLTKASMLVDFMFSPMGLNLKPKMFTPKPDKDGIQRPSTAMEHLEMFADDPKAKDFIQIIKTDSSVMKTYNTYVIGFLEHLRSDGRLHPTYYLFVGNQEEGEGGARTGRLSCKAPAFQTVPKHTTWAQRIRRCFPAPPGYVVVERDYGQGELRVIACIANETGMLAVFKSGRDIHADTAAPFAGYTYESLMALEKTDYHTFEETRQLGKAGNFGLVFGMYEDGFVAYARSNYGVELTWDEAHTFRTGFFKKYPRLIDYHKSSVQFAKLHKHVRTPLGRIRHLPLIKSPNRDVASKAERQAINSPVQGCLTDMGLWTIALEHRSGLAATAPCWGACHDSILNYVPEDKVDVLVPQMLDQMEQLPFHKVGWSPQLTFVADAKVGKNWGELKKFKRPLDK